MFKLLQGFKDFILRGNVIDLAVGIVVGAAFTALVGSFTASFIEPLIRVFGGGGGVDGKSGSFEVRGEQFMWASFVNALVTFVLTAAVLYFFVVPPMNRLAERRKAGQEPEPTAPSEEVLLLTEIRDALNRGAVPQQRPSSSADTDSPAGPA